MALPKTDHVRDQDRIRDYRTELPNIIDDFGLSVYAHRLYSHYKRACGPAGSCDQGVRYIANLCGMSIGKTSDAKKELVEAGLIWVEAVSSSNGPVDKVTLPDLWEYNFQVYFIKDDPEKRSLAIAGMKRSLCEHPLCCSSCELLRSRGELLRSRRELKKEHLKKEQSKNPDLSQPASQVTTPEPSLPSSHDDNRPNPVENAQADGIPASLKEDSDQPPSVPVVSPAYTVPVGTRWIYPLDGIHCHLVRDANQPTVTLCGITPLPSYGGPGDKTQVQCAECLTKAVDQGKPKHVRQPQPDDVLFDAIALHILQATTKADRDAVAWRVGQIMHGDKRSGRCKGLIAYEKARQSVDALDYAALALDVGAFWGWFKQKHPDRELKDCAKVMEVWVEWRANNKQPAYKDNNAELLELMGGNDANP